jgi:chemotaxis protein MotA
MKKINIFSIFGFLFILGIVAAGIVTTISPKEYHIFGDLPAIFLVLGGTFGVAAFTVQINRIGILLKAFAFQVIRSNRVNHKLYVREIMIAAEAYRRGDPMNDVINKCTDPFLKEGLGLIQDNILKGDDLYDVLSDRVKNMYSLYAEEANRFKNLAKFPPAYGLMGTVLGMIALLSNLGGADAMKMIGPAMGTCLVATFFGIVVANVIILPIGDSLADNAKEIYLKNKIVLEGLRLIYLKTNPIIVAERLNSFLLPSERLDWKAVAESAA